MARHPDWFDRLDHIVEVVLKAEHIERLGRNEMRAIFNCSERDSIRLLHKFGAEEQGDALSLPRESLLTQLRAIRSGARYEMFLRQRQEVARYLKAAGAEAAARQFRVKPADPEDRPARLQDLSKSITWRRRNRQEPGRFEILYDDGADLMRQLAEFLSAAGVNREEFFAGTEGESDGRSR